MIRVIAAVVDQTQLTLYKEDGETVSIPQGDPRLAIIVRAITPVLADGHGAVAEVDISKAKDENPYEEFETLFGKAIQFFQVDKRKLSGWLEKAASMLNAVLKDGLPETPPVPVEEMLILGEVPKSHLESAKSEKLLSAAEEIIAHAKPASHPEFNDDDTGETGSNTIVAVVGDKVIGDVEKLKPQIARAVKNNSAVGLSAFMNRVAKVTDKRRHSVEDLLKFLERGDLPIADDGTIIIYKVLRYKREVINAQGVSRRIFADCHTGKVTQRVGSYVCMDEDLVDPNRSNECSSGLHVARRQYVGGFSGDVVTLCKVAPEDVIAVPNYDANKMRVCGYHILFELSNDAFSKLKADKPFTDNDEAKVLLGRALAGDHPAPAEEVRITGEHGEGVVITPILPKIESPVIEGVLVTPTEALEPTKPKAELDAPKVDPKEVVRSLFEAKAESRKDKALRLYAEFNRVRDFLQQRDAAEELMRHKKATKLGWTALGLTEEVGVLLNDILKIS